MFALDSTGRHQLMRPLQALERSERPLDLGPFGASCGHSGRHARDLGTTGCSHEPPQTVQGSASTVLAEIAVRNTSIRRSRSGSGGFIRNDETTKWGVMCAQETVQNRSPGRG